MTCTKFLSNLYLSPAKCFVPLLVLYHLFIETLKHVTFILQIRHKMGLNGAEYSNLNHFIIPNSALDEHFYQNWTD